MATFPRCCWAYGALLLAVAGAAIFLAGVGASHTACWDADLDVTARIVIFASGGLIGHPSCAYSHGWSWLVVFVNVAAVVLACLALLWSRAAGARLGALALLTLSVSFLAPLCNSWLTMHYNLPAGHGQTAAAINCTIAGTIIACAGNLLLAFFLGWSHEGCKAVTTACCQKPHKPEPTPINANAADAAFTTKAAAALASQV